MRGQPISRYSSCLIAAALVLVLTSPALAYIDPGAGSLILQAIVGAIAAGLVVVKLWWHRIIRFVKAPFGGRGATSVPRSRETEPRT